MHLNASGPVHLVVGDDIVDTLIQVGRTMRQQMQTDGFDLGTFQLLKHLQAAGSMRVSELAGSVGLDTSTVSRHVTQLERSGLLSRTPDPDDRRAQRVQLTAHGSNVLHQAGERRRRFVAEALHEWNVDDLSELSRLLHRFREDVAARYCAGETA